jgi:hypothetical protein
VLEEMIDLPVLESNFHLLIHNQKGFGVLQIEKILSSFGTAGAQSYHPFYVSLCSHTLQHINTWSMPWYQ